MDHQKIVEEAKNYDISLELENLLDELPTELDEPHDTDNDELSEASQQASSNENEPEEKLPSLPVKSNSIEQEDKKCSLREQYYDHAAHILGWKGIPQLNWEVLASDVGTNRYLGESIDVLVVEKSFREGQGIKESAMLLSHSPYLHNTRNILTPEQREEYAVNVVEEAEINYQFLRKK